MGKTRSELREIIVHVLYESYILDVAKVNYNIEDLIKENYPILHDKDKLIDSKEVLLEYELDSVPVLNDKDELQDKIIYIYYYR